MTQLDPTGLGQPQQIAVTGPIPPQPVPTMFAVGQTQHPDGSLAVILVVHTPVTPSGAFYFLDGEQAEHLAAALGKLAASTKAGVLVAAGIEGAG